MTIVQPSEGKIVTISAAHLKQLPPVYREIVLICVEEGTFKISDDDGDNISDCRKESEVQ